MNSPLASSGEKPVTLTMEKELLHLLTVTTKCEATFPSPIQLCLVLGAQMIPENSTGHSATLHICQVTAEVDLGLYFFKSYLLLLLLLGCAGFLLLQGFFSSCHKWGLFCSCDVQACHCGGFSGCGAWVIGYTGSAACETFLDQGLNLCLLRETGRELAEFFTTEPPGKHWVSFLKPVMV